MNVKNLRNFFASLFVCFILIYSASYILFGSNPILPFICGAFFLSLAFALVFTDIFDERKEKHNQEYDEVLNKIKANGDIR